MNVTDEILDARTRAGAAIRNLGHAFVGRHMTAAEIDRLSEALERIADELWPGERRIRELEDLPGKGSEIPQGRLQPDFSDRPISGGASPWGLDLEISRVGDQIHARTELRAGHEGAPDRSHGGIVAALFDDVMGFVLGVARQPAFTGELTIRYLAPTPLHRPIECRSRLTERHGRKLTITGELVDLDYGIVTARASATFITVGANAFERMTAERPAPPDEG